MRIKVWLCAVVVAVAFTSVLTAGCEVSVMSYEKNYTRKHEGRMSTSFKLLQGTKENKLRVDAGQLVKFKYESTLNKGTLSLTVLGPDETQVMEFPSGEAGEKELSIPQSGTYLIKVQAEKASGHYSITWTIE